MEDLYGRNSVLEALRAGRPMNRIMLSKDSKAPSLKEIVSLARERKILLQFVEKKQLDQLSGGENHQGVMAQVAAKEYADWEEILTHVQNKGQVPLMLILDGVEDPHNLGAILRSADAAGAHCVIIPKHRAVPLTAGVARASAGAVEYVPVARVTNLAQTMEQMKDKGLWIAGADQEAQEPYYKTDLKGPLAVVLGSEGAGIGKLVREKCDFLVRIPMDGKVNSLNVSVAASLLLYEAVRQRSGQ